MKITWSVAGMRCEPGSVYAEEIIEGQTVIFKNISVLRNVGGSDIPAVTSEVCFVYIIVVPQSIKVFMM